MAEFLIELLFEALFSGVGEAMVEGVARALGAPFGRTDRQHPVAAGIGLVLLGAGLGGLSGRDLAASVSRRWSVPGLSLIVSPLVNGLASMRLADGAIAAIGRGLSLDVLGRGLFAFSVAAVRFWLVAVRARSAGRTLKIRERVPTMTAPDRFETDRLLLRRPRPDDAAAIFNRYASDPEVTRWVGWPRHRTIADTEGFLAFCEAEWARAPGFAYLIERRADGALLGSTGLAFESPCCAMTGYVLARDAWGQGYATEALRGIVALAPGLGVRGSTRTATPTTPRRPMSSTSAASPAKVSSAGTPSSPTAASGPPPSSSTPGPGNPARDGLADRLGAGSGLVPSWSRAAPSRFSGNRGYRWCWH